MAYVLGFFAADGYITVNKRGGQFWCIQICDKDLLEYIRNAIGSNHKIGIRNYKDKKTIYRLQIGSIEMCNDLRSLGYDQNKTHTLSVPNIPLGYLSDFVRGYFDGDGNVWCGYVHKDRKKQTLCLQAAFTSCSYRFIETLQDKLYQIGLGKGYFRKIKETAYRLVYSTQDSLKLYKFMYNCNHLKNNLYLERKKVVFERFIALRM